MCLAVPMRIVEVRDHDGVAEAGGVRRKVRLDLVPEARVGQYVLVHAGFAIQVLTEQEARDTVALVETLLVEREDEG